MGDRTVVTLTVLAEQSPQTFEVLKNFGHYRNHLTFDEILNSYDLYEGEGFHSFVIMDVNYADFDAESAEILTHGIAHNVHWCAGSNYGAGRNYYRFNQDGEVFSLLSIDDTDFPTIQVSEVMDLVENQSKSEVLASLEEYIALNSEPSWDHQLEYGQIKL